MKSQFSKIDNARDAAVTCLDDRLREAGDLKARVREVCDELNLLKYRE